MTLRLVSHVNRDSDLIEAWLKYYLELGVERFHLVVHGGPAENDRLLAIRDSYPIEIEDSYCGSFHIEEKRKRLDAVLARHTGQWIVLVDSDEFVELPYKDFKETVCKLESAHANLMAAPLLQRLTEDGSLETPPVIENPFEKFPLCSQDLYRRMGVKGDIFKFPLFYCANGTRLAEGGNHHPPLGPGPRASSVLGVTHHFKFRRVVSDRLQNRIESDHPWRHESVQFRNYLESHANHLPLEGTFRYSREELVRRRLLRKLAEPEPTVAEAGTESLTAPDPNDLSAGDGLRKVTGTPTSKPEALAASTAKRILFVLPNTAEFGGLELHLFEFLQRLKDTGLSPWILCFGRDNVSARMDRELLARTVVECVEEPESLWDWVRLFRRIHPDIIVFCYSWIKAFPWQGPAAALVAGVRKRFSIQHLIPPAPPPPEEGSSLASAVRRVIGRRARYMLKMNLTGHVCQKTICVSDAVRNALVRDYGFPPRKTITIRNGAATATFVPSKEGGSQVRTRLGISPEDFLLVCVARLSQEKGVDIVLHAVSRVLRQGIPTKCIILGDGPLKEKLIEEANSLGLYGYVFFEGFQQDVRPYLQAASAFILTSHMEGLPLSVLEAMACGLPSIVTNVGGSAEAVRDQEVGLVIPDNSLDAAEEAILRLVTHPEERARMAIKARETVCQNFDLDDRMSELRQVILN